MIKVGLDEMIPGIGIIGALISQSPIIIYQSITLGAIGILLFIVSVLGMMIYEPN